MKQVAGRLRIDQAQYRDQEAFTKFGSDLDKATQQQLHRGQRLVEILKQDQYVPMQFEQQIAIIFAATNGYTDPVPIHQIRRFEKELLAFLQIKHPQLMPDIAKRKVLDDDIKQRLTAAMEEFGKLFKTEEK